MLYKWYLKLFPSNGKTSMTEFLMKQKHNGLVGAELGVKYGENALSILKHLDIKKLYLIDHYSKYIEYGQEMDYGYAYPIAVHKLRKYEDKTHFIIEDANISHKFISESLDFIWIDVSGEFATIYNVLNNFYPLVKPGGMIGGKRFTTRWYPLCRAVFKFEKENNLELKEGCNSGDWWFVKPYQYDGLVEDSRLDGETMETEYV